MSPIQPKMKRSLAIVLTVSAFSLTAFLFNNCAKKDSSVFDSTGGGGVSSCGENLSASMREPKTIDQAMTLIRALPTPLTLDCFLRALKGPLQVFSTTSVSSAQPAGGPTNPRIFIINENLILSVVPVGVSKFQLEFSELVSATHSIKGELKFPLYERPPVHAPYTQIFNNGPGSGTSCSTCHRNESRATMITAGEAYISEILRPDMSTRVSQTSMKNAALNCNAVTEPYRCAMLSAIFIDGEAQDATSFP